MRPLSPRSTISGRPGKPNMMVSTIFAMVEHQFKIIAIRNAKLLGRQKRHEKLQLQRRVIKLQERSNNGNTRDIENYRLAKEKLKQLELKELEATKIKSSFFRRRRTKYTLLLFS